MTSILNAEQVQSVRTFIFKNGRLLERQLFEYFLGGGAQQACLKALLAYQNEDGGFGNGIEPDLLCPASSAIGAETALYVLDVLDCGGCEAAGRLSDWVEASQSTDGTIPHPPAHFDRYPCQPGWKNPDRERVLSLAGMMKKWGLGTAGFFARARQVFLNHPAPEVVEFYDYPYFVYLKYCLESETDQAQFEKMVAGLSGLLEKHRGHFPLFNRAWYHAAEFVEKETLVREAAFFVRSIHPDGEIDSPYPQFPLWNPIFLLDGLVMLKRFGFLYPGADNTARPSSPPAAWRPSDLTMSRNGAPRAGFLTFERPKVDRLKDAGGWSPPAIMAPWQPPEPCLPGDVQRSGMFSGPLLAGL